ncbi:hypothetical protein RMR16_006170 [Agrobacterium sp. rho-13.3]|uniref:hypothetical protein n=1 Tax=Agrobacterium sp. rho-13.3 TaxID=3072980 RepID=UPI002A14BA23|nr:hypothetical protein [Agrobacterium sp. rho-13.3]MDX8309389.1 hypothetical protein [Agrobacterium sp. rho-13.3]
MAKSLDMPSVKKISQSFGTVIRAAAKRGAAATHIKPKFSVPKMKQVAKLAQTMGQTVTAYTVNGDGGFTITAADPSTLPNASGPSEWD